VDVDTATPERVLEAARPRFEELERKRETEALERLGERGARGPEEVLVALNERRVETLMLDENFSGAGVQCPECGWLGPEGERRCPVDGTSLVILDDLAEAAIELALQQSAEVLALRFDPDALAADGGIAALLRF
jgi:peptide subunit release factor 1 (eRF1)